MADKTKVYHISKRSDGKWAIKFAGGEKVIKTFATKEEAMKYVRSGKCNYVQIAVPTFWIKEISEEEHQKERKDIFGIFSCSFESQRGVLRFPFVVSNKF